MSYPVTKKLRDLLDKHGIPWRSKYNNKTMWKVTDPMSGNETRFSAWGCSNGSLTVSVENDYNYTPEMAVARTLFIAAEEQEML